MSRYKVGPGRIGNRKNTQQILRSLCKISQLAILLVQFTVLRVRPFIPPSLLPTFVPPSITHSLPHSQPTFTNSPRSHPVTHSPTQLPTTSTHSLIHAFTHSLTHSLTHSFTHSLTHSLIHSITHSILTTMRETYSRYSKVEFPDSICAKALRPAGPVFVPQRLQNTSRSSHPPITEETYRDREMDTKRSRDRNILIQYLPH